MVERIEFKQITSNTQPTARVNPASNAERDEKRKHFNNQLQKELNDKDKKQNEENTKKNIDITFAAKGLRNEKQLEDETINKTENKINTDLHKIDIYI